MMSRFSLFEFAFNCSTSLIKTVRLLLLVVLVFVINTNTSAQNIRINEIGISTGSSNTFYDSGGGGEFIELINVGSTCENIGCWIIMFSGSATNPTGWTILIPSGVVILPGKTYLIGGGGRSRSFSTWGNITQGPGNPWFNLYGTAGLNNADLDVSTNAAYCSGINSIQACNFNNTNGQVNLYNNSGVIQTAVCWNNGNSTGSYPAKTNSSNPGCTPISNLLNPSSSYVNNVTGSSFNNSTGFRGVALQSNGTYLVTNSLTPGMPNPNGLTSTASTPTFSFSNAICLSSAPTGPLPITSNNGYTGTWSPASINTSSTTVQTYTFTPSNCVNPFYLTVTPARSAGTLNGVQNICTSGGTSTATFTSTVSGGTWSSSNSAVATINSTSGVISPLSAGTATMTYTVTGTGGCSNATATRTITVTSAPSAGILSGIQTICFNQTTTFTSTVAGGAWTSGNTSIATINSLTGAIVVVSAGATTMTYTVTGTGGCSNATLNRTLTINPIPNPFPFISDVTPAPSASAPLNTVCSGSAVTLSTIKPDSVFYNRTTVSIPDNGLLATPPPPYTSLISLQSANYRGSNISINFPSGYNPIIDATTLPIVNVKISHLRPKDLRIYLVRKTPLVANDDIIIPLCLNRNFTNNTLNNFDSTIFSMSASVPIGNGFPPFAGSYIPEQSFNSFIGKPIAGDWYIRIADNVLNGTASSALQYWSIKFGETDPNIYNWSNGSNTISTVVSPTTTTNYTLQVTNTFGCSSQSSITVNVTQPPNTGNLTGDQNVCVGSTTNFTSDVSGGTWSSPSGSTIASVSSSGVVFGLSQGTETMTYTVPGTGGCSSSTATRTVTVTAAPNAGNISGTNAICSNGSTILNSNGDIGGIWSSNNTAVATINSTTGAVLPVASGYAIITYTVNGTGGCSDVSSTPFNFTVNDNPTVNVSSSSTCVGGSATVTANTLGIGPYSYNWTVPSGATNPDNVGQFSTNVSGPYSVVVTNTTTGCSSIQATDTVRFTTPQPPSLSGGSSLCLTNTNFSLEPSILGGTFNSSNPSIASINNSGNITPISAGATTITYTIGSGACQGTATQSITIIAPPDAGSLSGVQNICSNGSTIFVSTGASTAGSWSSGNESIATINATSGIITPVSTAINGTVTMTYTVAGTGGCEDAIETRDVTITTLPNAGTLSGDQSICANATSTFISTGASDQGVWSSGNTSVASIDATTGVITPASAGIATMTYTVAGTGGCSNATSTRTITVTAAPNAGAINGTTEICTNTSPAFTSNGNTGGSWSSDNSTVVSINSSTGIVTPINAGSANISYTVFGTGGCINATSIIAIAVSTAPNAGSIIGTTAICSTGSTTLSSSGNVGGTWNSSNTSVASINSTTGSVTAVGAGTATMIYTVAGTGGCANATSTTLVTVTAAPNAGSISGPSTVCLNGSATLSSSGSGGSWLSNNTNCAVINPTSGVITPVATGTATISYTVAGTGGCSDVTSSADISVIAPPNASIVNNTGTNVITCAQPSIDVVATGGNSYVWSNGLGANPNLSITSPGNYTVTVTGTGGCISTASINITQNITRPTVAITNNSGTTALTCTQPTISLTATGNGSYSWSSGLGTNAAVTIGSAGTYIVTATGTNGCTSTAQVIVTASAGIPTPSINNITGSTELNCVRSSISVSATGGTSYSWSNGLGNNANATITQPGTYTVTVTGSNGCSATAQITITRDVSAPNATIQNNSNTAVLTCTQTSIALTANGGGNYSWSNSLGTSSSVNITNPGDYTVTVTGTNGCISTASVSITRDITPPITTITNNTGTVALTCTQTSISLTATGGDSYSWNNGLGTNANVLVTSAGIYIVTATGTNGCASSAQVTITASSGLPTAVISNITGTTELNCTNDTINLTATGGVSYIWSNGLGNNANVVVTNPGTYSVTVTASNGCSATADIQITENFLLPAAAITNNSVTTVLTCAQPTINLTAAGGVGYAWNNGLGNVASVLIGAAGNYVVTVTGANGCTSTAQIDITASSDLPVASIQNNTGQTILDCNTTQINLQAQGGGTYSWSNGLGTNQTVNILLPGTYTVTVTGSNGCSASTQVNITQDITPPNIVIINNSNSTVLNCNHPVINLTATGGATYNWNQGLGNSPDVTIVTPGNYSVSVSGNNGCVSDAQIDIIQGQTSAVASLFTASACGTYNLPWGEIASSSGDYIHTYTTIQGCDSIVTATISIVPGAGVSTSFAATSCSSYALPWGDVVTSTGAYTHTYISAEGCDSIVTANITIDIPIEPLFSPVAVCIGSNYQLPFTSDNGVTGLWSPAFDNTASATYQFIPDAGQCAVITSLNVLVNPNDPEPLFTPVDRICVGTNFVLPAVSNNGIAGSWTPAINNTTTTTYSFTPTAGQCPVIAEMLVVVNPLPQGNFTASQSSICEGDSVQLNATAADSYQWYFNNNPLPGAVGSNYFATQEGAYTVEYVSDSGCKVMATQVATLSLTRKPDVVFAAPSTCPGKLLSFNSESDVSASLPVTYNWNFGNGQISNQQQDVTTYEVGGSYIVTLTVTPDACPQLADSVTRSVLVYEPRTGISYNAIDAVVHEPVNLLARAPGRSYLWTPSTGLNSDNIRNPVLDPTREVTFTIRISDLNGCETVDTQFVRIHNKTDIQVPQVFTPNGDGNNDLLYPFIIGIKTLKYFRVYNRWGNLLFESNDWNTSKGWNGTLRGKPQPAETYIWVAEGIDADGKTIKRGGNIILVR